MASTDGEKPDDSSIKPVSSLRAQFEDISTKRGPPPFKGPKPTILKNDEPERGRISLDTPRSSRGWNGDDRPLDTSHRPLINSTTKPRPTHITPGSHSRQRPVSMGPWSPPKSTPGITIQSSVSPPKALFTPKISHKDTTNDTRQSAELSKQRVISSSPTRNPRGLNDAPDFQSPYQVQPRKPSPNGFRRPPPPVNRASKPATPVATPVASAFNLGLDLSSMNKITQDKVSPFSTPPSSDGSLERESSPEDDDEDFSIAKAPMNVIPVPPVHHATEARRAATVTPRESTGHPRMNSTISTSRDVPCQRPVLPIRVEHENPPPQPARPITRQNTSNTAPIQPPRPPILDKDHSASTHLDRTLNTNTEYLPPPPKRNLIPSKATSVRSERDSYNPPTMSRAGSAVQSLPAEDGRATNSKTRDSDVSGTETSVIQTPDNAQANRRPPKSKSGSSRIWTQYDTRSLDLCGNYVCTGGVVFRAWDTSNSRMITDYAPDMKDLRVTAFVFKPGSKPETEGLIVWIGSNMGEIQEIDLKRQAIQDARPDAHGRRGIIKMLRHQNSIWSLDDEGKLLIWPAGSDGLPSLRLNPKAHKVVRGYSCCIVVKDMLWLAAGRNIHIYNPKGGDSSFHVTTDPISQPFASEITCTAVMSNQLDKVYFGHSDGKISIYSTSNFSCLGLISASPYRINCLAGAGVYLWAGFNTGMIYVYDTQSKPWKIKKEWHAHQKSSVSSIVVDLSSVWKTGHLQVATLGTDNAICFWDGMLEDDWIENHMKQNDVKFCTFKEISTVVMTWNAGASTPGNLRFDPNDSDSFREALRPETAPDILVFGFQELVDLEDKKLTAKSIFKGSKKKAPSEVEHMSHQYRAWRDHLIHVIDEVMPPKEAYSLLHTASMVGLFSCVFVKSHLRGRIRNLNVAEVKRGLGGLHGNKGAIILRFILEDSSICFTNCHLAAGQTQTANRNADITAILDATSLPEEKDPEKRITSYIGGGDGAMITDHEICIINGDLNYRIDTMSRDTVIKAIKSGGLNKLLERDQLLVSRRRNPGFRLRAFQEQPITFIPTYKYDVGTDRFDTSEKGRSPAWCDRILYRGFGQVKQLDYRRHELKLSDHRPVSALFLMRLKTVDAQKRAVLREQAEDYLADMRETLAMDAKLSYLVNVLGVQEKEARHMLAQQSTV